MNNEALMSAIATLNNPAASLAEKALAAQALSSVTSQIRKVESEQANKLGFRISEKGSVGLYNLPAYKMIDGVETRTHTADGSPAKRKFPLSATPRQWLKVMEFIASGEAAAFLRANYGDECNITLDRLGL